MSHKQSPNCFQSIFISNQLDRVICSLFPSKHRAGDNSDLALRVCTAPSEDPRFAALTHTGWLTLSMTLTAEVQRPLLASEGTFSHVLLYTTTRAITNKTLKTTPCDDYPGFSLKSPGLPILVV